MNEREYEDGNAEGIAIIVINTVFDALSIGGGLVAAVALRIISGKTLFKDTQK